MNEVNKMNYTEMALQSWYQPDNPLYRDPRHPLIKLAGEAGELLDLFGKEEYKPNFSWWDCKHCDYGDASHSLDKVCSTWLYPLELIVYTPLVLDELGDYSYYLRILLWQQGMNFEEYANIGKSIYSLEMCLNRLSHYSTWLHWHWLEYSAVSQAKLITCMFYFANILACLDCDLDHLMQLNYRKLNSDPTQHGWKR